MIALTIANEKGGVGKTISAVAIAHGLTQCHKWSLYPNWKVLLIDLDPLGHCGAALGMVEGARRPCRALLAREMKNMIRSTNRYLLDCLDLSPEALYALHCTPSCYETIAEQLGAGLRLLSPSYDFAVIDTPPGHENYASDLGLNAADLVIVPTTADYLAWRGAEETIRRTIALNGPGFATHNVAILPVAINPRRDTDRVNLETYRLNRECLPPIPASAAAAECAEYGASVWEHARYSTTVQGWRQSATFRAGEGGYKAAICEILDASKPQERITK